MTSATVQAETRINRGGLKIVLAREDEPTSSMGRHLVYITRPDQPHVRLCLQRYRVASVAASNYRTMILSVRDAWKRRNAGVLPPVPMAKARDRFTRRVVLRGAMLLSIEGRRLLFASAFSDAWDVTHVRRVDAVVIVEYAGRFERRKLPRRGVRVLARERLTQRSA